MHWVRTYGHCGTDASSGVSKSGVGVVLSLMDLGNGLTSTISSGVSPLLYMYTAAAPIAAAPALTSDNIKASNVSSAHRILASFQCFGRAEMDAAILHHA